MTSVHSTLTSVVCKNGNAYSPVKFPSTAFLPGFDVTGRVFNHKKEMCPALMSSGPRATLTFDSPTTNVDKAKNRKHTVDPTAPEFEPLPSFEQCFPKSIKEYRCLFIFLSCMLYFTIFLSFVFIFYFIF